MKTVVFNNLNFVLGQSATENWRILAKAEKYHIWAHLDDYTSAHVIIETDDPTEGELEFARQLILQQTKKAPFTAKLITASVSMLKRGNLPGEVIIKS